MSVSGSGNVAQYAVEKAMALGARVVTVSDSSGTIVDEQGFTPEKLAELMDVKNHHYGRVSDYAKRTRTRASCRHAAVVRAVDVALPCATQNELTGDDARTLVKNGVLCVAEGANMPSTIDAVQVFEEAGVLFAPGKASNAGGVATSGLEMSQNAMRLSLAARGSRCAPAEHHAAASTRPACSTGGARTARISYVDGANIAGFVKVADAMLAQGVI